jgi:hypothetical protein
MAKKVALVRRLENCQKCPYYAASWCNNSAGWRIVKDHNIIPDWCPLEDWSDTDIGKV